MRFGFLVMYNDLVNLVNLGIGCLSEKFIMIMYGRPNDLTNVSMWFYNVNEPVMKSGRPLVRFVMSLNFGL